MKDNKSRYTLRVEQELLDKLGYIAEYEGRTKNRELERLVRQHIEVFAKEHGKIEVEVKQPRGCFFFAVDKKTDLCYNLIRIGGFFAEGSMIFPKKGSLLIWT